MNGQQPNQVRTAGTTVDTTPIVRESLLGRRRQQQQQRDEDGGRHQKMMAMLTMRQQPKCHRSPATSNIATRPVRNNYVERLCVQLPPSLQQQQQQSSHALVNNEDDVLRLVIHVEESQPDEEEEEEDEEGKASLSLQVEGPSLNKDERHQQQENRRMLKHIGRRRSASVELRSKDESSGTRDSLASHLVGRMSSDEDDVGQKTRQADRPCDRLSPCHPNSSIRSTSPRSNAVIKEFRRSSELLRNILLSLSASSVSSRRSSDGSTVSSLSTAVAASLVVGSQQQQQQQQMTAESTSSYVNALQAHRKRRWAVHLQQELPATIEPTSTAGSSGSMLLFEAIASSNWTWTSHVLDGGLVTDVNAPLNDTNGYTALHWCAVQTPVPWPAVFLLLEHGCKVEQRDKDGTQPVFLLPNLPRVQQQLVNDAFDYLIRGCGPDSAASVAADRKGEADGDEAETDEDARRWTSTSTTIGAPTTSVGGVNNILRRLQQSAIINQAGHYLHQHHPHLLVNKKSQESNVSPSGGVSGSTDYYDSFEITSIKVSSLAACFVGGEGGKKG